MKPYTTPTTVNRRRHARGTEQLQAFPQQDRPPPRRGVTLDALTVFHLTFDATKPARSS